MKFDDEMRILEEAAIYDFLKFEREELMHDHTDKPCEHNLKVCTECGNVYCSKCNKEWFKEQYTSYPYPYWGGTYTIPAGGTVTCNTTINDPVQETHTHANQ